MNIHHMIGYIWKFVPPLVALLLWCYGNCDIYEIMVVMVFYNTYHHNLVYVWSNYGIEKPHIIIVGNPYEITVILLS